MFIFALISLSFSGWMAWTLYSDKRDEEWLGYIGTAWIAVGSLSGVVVAVTALIKAVW